MCKKTRGGGISKNGYRNPQEIGYVYNDYGETIFNISLIKKIYQNNFKYLWIYD